MLSTKASTHSSEVTLLPRHGQRTTYLGRRHLRLVGDFVQNLSRSRHFSGSHGFVFIFHLPSCICEVITFFIWFSETVHFDRIIEAGGPDGVSYDLHDS